MLGTPTTTPTVGVAGVHGHKPDAANVGDAHCRHPLLERSVADGGAMAEWKARVNRSVERTILQIPQRVWKTLIPPEWLQGLQSGRCGLEQDHDIGLCCMFSDSAGVCLTVERVQTHEPEFRRFHGSMIIDKQRRQPSQVTGSQRRT